MRGLYARFVPEADGPLNKGAGTSGRDEGARTAVDLEAEIAAGPPTDLVAPGGEMLLVRFDGEPAAIGGVRHLDTDVAEVKSMFVAPEFRGLGLGRRVLDELHAIAAARGCGAVRLDTSSYLSEAIGLYRAAGYREVADYNGNPKADMWFERALG